MKRGFLRSLFGETRQASSDLPDAQPIATFIATVLCISECAKCQVVRFADDALKPYRYRATVSKVPKPLGKDMFVTAVLEQDV